MARISFTSSMEEIIGKFGGNVFQDSYFGIQLRGLAKPRNPQTQLQQLRRGDFGFLSASWRYLSSTDKTTWITEAGTIPEALRLFIGSNVNLIISGISTITSFVTSTTPVMLPVVISGLDVGLLTVSASTSTTIVPSGFNLVLFATDQKKPGHQFSNPSDFYPIETFPAGSDFSGDVDVLSAWSNQYGVLQANRYMCVFSAMINAVNGARVNSGQSCASTTPIITDYLINSDGTFIIDSDGTFINQ